MRRFFKLATLGAIVAALALYLVDAVVLEVRGRHGSAYRVIQVNQFLTTPLKGQKEEYDALGTLPVTCSRSIFPQRGFTPCWWVERHTNQWQ
jgi:hypothetical protein